MTPRSQRLILDALRRYKRENLTLAKAISRRRVNEDEDRSDFAVCMSLDDAIELAIQEIAVAQ